MPSLPDLAATCNQNENFFPITKGSHMKDFTEISPSLIKIIQIGSHIAIMSTTFNTTTGLQKSYYSYRDPSRGHYGENNSENGGCWIFFIESEK